MNVLHIKPVYHTYDATRMKWFGFLARFWLILSILFNLRNIVTAFEDGYVVLARLTLMGVLFLNVVAVVQLNRRRWTGVLALLGMSGLRLLTEFYAVLRYFYLDMDIVFTASDYYDLLADVIITLIFMSLNWVYFSKRRLLFAPLPDWYQPESSAVTEDTRKEDIL